MTDVTGRIHSIESFGTLDGPGIRFVVFLQGCPLKCKFCHNPDTWDAHGGTETSVGELLKKIDSCRNYLRNGGVTLSGGEPLLQKDFTLALLQACHADGFHTAIDTAGSLPLAHSRACIDAADLLLLDIKALDPVLCQSLTGRDNSNELATLRYCEEHDKPIWIRHVMVPEWTLDRQRLTELAEFLKPFRCIKRVDLLPYHKMGSYKWKELGKVDPFEKLREPTQDEVQAAQEIFASFNQGR